MAPRVKTIEDLQDEKNFVSEEIVNSFLKIEPDKLSEKSYSKRFKFFVASFGLEKKNLKENPALAGSLKKSFDSLYRNTTGKLNHICHCISVYKHAAAEHKALMESNEVSDTIKQISANNLKDYESLIFKSGIDKEEFRLCLARKDYENYYRVQFGKKVYEGVQEVAKENGLEITQSQTLIENCFADYVVPKKEFDPFVSLKNRKVMETFSKYDTEYYEEFKCKGINYPYDHSMSRFKYFIVQDGKYVDRPYPNGFLAKIGYFFSKLFNSGSEKKLIAEEQKALDKATEYAKTHEVFGDISKFEEKIKEDVAKETAKLNKELQDKLAKDKENTEKEIDGNEKLSKEEQESKKELMNNYLDKDYKAEKEFMERRVFEEHLIEELKEDYLKRAAKEILEDDAPFDEEKDPVGPGLDQVD